MTPESKVRFADRAIQLLVAVAALALVIGNWAIVVAMALSIFAQAGVRHQARKQLR
jgi:hypothetical protein